MRTTLLAALLFAVSVISAASAQVLHFPSFPINGDSMLEWFGASVSGAGDVNNDGFADIIVGAIFDDNTGNDSGSARVFSGATSALLYTFNGDSAGDQFGRSVSGAGDVNRDGFDDLVVGAFADDNNGIHGGGSTEAGAAGNVTMSWTNTTSSHWAILGVSIEPADVTAF